MKTKTIHCGVAIGVILQLGVLAASAQTTEYGPAGSETNVTLNPGTYIITAYGAAGGPAHNPLGGLGAEMSAEFNFSSPTYLTLLVGRLGSPGGANSGQTFIDAWGGGGGSFVVEGSTPLVVAGGGGGGAANGDLIADGGDASITPGGGGGGDDLFSDYFGAGGGGGGGSFIDSSAIAIITEVSGVNSPDYGLKGEIIITAVPEPASASLLAIGSLALLVRRRRPHFLLPQESI